VVPQIRLMTILSSLKPISRLSGNNRRLLFSRSGDWNNKLFLKLLLPWFAKALQKKNIRKKPVLLRLHATDSLLLFQNFNKLIKTNHSSNSLKSFLLPMNLQQADPQLSIYHSWTLSRLSLLPPMIIQKEESPRKRDWRGP